MYWSKRLSFRESGWPPKSTCFLAPGRSLVSSKDRESQVSSNTYSHVLSTSTNRAHNRPSICVFPPSANPLRRTEEMKTGQSYAPLAS